MHYHQMLPHIFRHSQLVANVALLLARKLNQYGYSLDLALVEAGALLHDVAKTMCLDTKDNHADSGSELIGALGYDSVADIVRQHICLDPEVVASDMVTEAALVNYADKRVKHEEVVCIEERFRDVKERYMNKFPNLEDRFKQVFVETQLVEKKIFSSIDISPEDIKDLL
jgi:putative nucleotidyltransferase with HDIG domain